MFALSMDALSASVVSDTSAFANGREQRTWGNTETCVSWRVAFVRIEVGDDDDDDDDNSKR